MQNLTEVLKQTNIFFRIEKLMLFAIIISMPIISAPKRFAIPFLGHDASYYFAWVGIIALMVECYILKIQINKKIKFYFFLFIAYIFFCNAVGLYCYEYNGYLTLNLIPKLDWIIYNAQLKGIELNELTMLKVWLWGRLSKQAVIVLLPILILPILVLRVYKNNFKDAFYYARKVILVMCVFICIYSLIEVIYLKVGNKVAESILITVNPFFYDPRSSGTSWPPLLWPNQLRSFFPEPAMFCMYSSMCLPFLWSYVIERKPIQLVFPFLTFFSFLLVGSGSRGGIVVFSFQLLLLLILTFKKRNTVLYKATIVIFLSIFLAFFINLINFKEFTSAGEFSSIEIYDSLKDYQEKNVNTILDTKKRSNGSRLSNNLGTLLVIKEHPIFGVGTGLRSIYLMEKMTEENLETGELYFFTNNIKLRGPFMMDYPNVNFYTEFIVQYGFIGFLIFAAPYVFLFLLLWNNWHIILEDYQCCMTLIAFLGLLLFMVNTPVLLLGHTLMAGMLLCKVRGTN